MYRWSHNIPLSSAVAHACAVYNAKIGLYSVGVTVDLRLGYQARLCFLCVLCVCVFFFNPFASFVCSHVFEVFTGA